MEKKINNGGFWGTMFTENFKSCWAKKKLLLSSIIPTRHHRIKQQIQKSGFVLRVDKVALEFLQGWARN